MRFFLATSNHIYKTVFDKYIYQLPYEEYGVTSNLEMIHAKDGISAYKMIQKDVNNNKRIDLLLSEQRMKGITGAQLVTFLRTEPSLSSIPVLMFDSVADVACLDQIKDLGVKTFFLFPVTYEEFKKHLTSMVERLINQEEGDRKLALERFSVMVEEKYDTDERDNIYMRSLEHINKIKRLAPWSHLAMLETAMIHCGMNNFKLALPFAKEYIRQHFSSHMAHKLLDLCYKRLGKSYEEVAELNLTLQYGHDSPGIRLKLGEAYFREDNYITAKEHFIKAIAMCEKSNHSKTLASAHVGMGKAFSMQADQEKNPSLKQEAITEFEKGRNIDPLLLSAYLNLIIVLKETGDEDRAKKIYKELVAITPEDAEGWFSLFEAYLSHGDTNKARTMLDRAIVMDPENLKVLMDAGIIYIRQSMFSEAIKVFSQYNVINPSDKRIYNYLGICYRHLNYYQLAVEAYSNALKIDSKDGAIYFNNGRVYEEMGQKKKAIECYESALFLDPDLDIAKQALKEIEGEPV